MTEDLVRDLLSEQARAIPTDVDLLRGVAAQRRVRRRRSLVSGTTGIAVVIVLAAVGTTVAVRHGSPVTRNGPAVSSAPTTYPAGTRPVTWAGIQLDVPATWTDDVSDQHRCAAQDAKPGGEVDYVGSDVSAAYACSDATHPVHQRLELGTDYSLQAFAAAQAGPPGTLESTPTTLAGYAARRVQVGMLGQLVTKITVPQLKTVFTLTTNTSAEVSAIVATARVVIVDENGCPVTQSTKFPTTGDTSPGSVLTTVPVGGIVCAYSAGTLQRGVSLDGRSTAALDGALRRLPARYTAAQLRAQRTELGSDGATVLQLTLRDSAGRAQRVTVSRDAGVAGAHSAALTQELIDDLYPVVPGGFLSVVYGGAYPFGCGTCVVNTPIPAPTRPVTYRGITLNVPATWIDTTQPCQLDGGSVVRLTPAADHNYSCVRAAPQLVVTTLNPDAAFFAHPSGSEEQVTFAGFAAAFSSGFPSAAGSPASVVVDLTSSTSEFRLRTASLADADAILATARPAGT